MKQHHHLITAMESVVDVNNASTGRHTRATNPMECQMRAQWSFQILHKRAESTCFIVLSLVRLWFVSGASWSVLARQIGFRRRTRTCRAEPSRFKQFSAISVDFSIEFQGRFKVVFPGSSLPGSTFKSSLTNLNATIISSEILQ